MAELDERTSMLALEVRCGAPGIDDEPANPLARATRSLLAGGRRSVSAIPAILVEEAGLASWLGFFVLTEASRLVFFPGVSFPIESVEGALSDGRSRIERELRVDHLTLEADRRTWHLTDAAGRERQGGGRTQDVGEGRRLWFTITAAGTTDLRTVKRRTIVTYRPAVNQAEARAREDRFCRAVSNGAASPIRLLARPPEDYVLHVAVTVSAPEAPPYNGHGMPLPLSAPGVEKIALPVGTQGAFGRLLLSSAVEVQILAAWLPGTMQPGAPILAYALDSDGPSPR